VNGEPSSEDRTILAVLDSLEREPGEPLASDDSSETAETLARLYTEVLGLVPSELDPVAPKPELKARLLSAIQPGAPAVSAAEPRPIPPRPMISRAPSSAPRVAMVQRRRSIWPAALAASLILALGGYCGWLLTEQTRLKGTIADLQGEVAAERLRAEQAMAGMRTATERMRENFQLVTTPAVAVSPLRPVGDEASPARGLLFVAADHQHWYLALHDCPPAGQGRDYQLWWITDGGIYSGGTFDPRAGEKVELYSKTMPDNTRGVMVTLETEGGVRAPTGPEILRGAGFNQL
jgi:hypothetical protein